MNALRKVCMKFKDKTESGGFPAVTASLLSLGTGIAILGRSEKNGGGPVGYLKRAGNKMYSFLRKGQNHIPTLPSQDKARPVLMFDCSAFLLKKNFSFFSLDFLVTKRAFSDVFLFHTAHLYELIHISDSQTDFNRLLLQKIDPYGCISYKIYCEDKKMFTKKHLNRPLEKTVVISTKDDEYNKDFNENILVLKPWQGRQEPGLLDLINFLYNLHFINVVDFRSTIKSYWRKDFHSVFDRVQERIFTQRNIFTWNVRKRYKEKIDELNRKRIEEFKKAKNVMDADLRGGKTEETSVLGHILDAVTKACFWVM